MSFPIADTSGGREVVDPREVTGRAGDALYTEIAVGIKGLPANEAWPSLQGKLSAISAEVGGAVGRLPGYRNLPQPSGMLAFDEDLNSSKAKVAGYHKDALALANVLKAEWSMGARPQVLPEREGYARQDVAALLEGPDALKTMLDIARGPNRDRAAVVLGDYGDVLRTRLMPNQSERARFTEGLNRVALDGAIQYGTVAERQHATAAKNLAPKVDAYVATRVVPALGRLKDAEATRP